MRSLRAEQVWRERDGRNLSITMKTTCAVAFILLVQGWALPAFADFKEEMKEAQAAITPVLEGAEKLVVEGRLDEANQKLLAVFPAESRSAAQALTLGNVLFTQDPKLSYELHKRAAKELPDEPNAILEWAMEQHRAGEYAGAAESYQQFAKANPRYAPVLGMLAECLLRTGKIREAADAWQRSEEASQGTIEQFESLVCEVNGHKYPDHERVVLREKARQGDLDAAEKLIALDGAFERDWWNKNPRRKYLELDLKLLGDAKFDDAERLREIVCAGECELARAEDRDASDVLRKHSFLLGDRGALPRSGTILSIMLGAAERAKAVTVEEARTKWGAAILDAAKARRDAEMFNVAAHLYIGTDKLSEIERQGWETTGDERCAAGYMFGLAEKQELRLDDARLVKASQQFPENAMVAAIVLALTKKEGKPLEPALVRAIKAEYSRFSMQMGLFDRPGAAALRKYFRLLAKELPAN